MSTDDTDDTEDVDQRVDALLAAYDDALAQGAPINALDTSDLTPGQRKLLDRRLTSLHRLRSVLPAGPATQAWTNIGRFRLVRELGRGGYGIVYLAEDPILGRDVALKVPRPECVLDSTSRDRFLREAQAAASLDHPNIVAVHETGQVGPACYIASAYCPGKNLAAQLRERAECYPAAEAASVVATLARGVQHAHERGVIHRDLKPANIIMSPDGQPKITDFGLARFLDSDEGQTASGAVVGTPAYMAPEQASGNRELVGPTGDVYALGVILYEMLTGRPPFRGATVLETLEQVRTQEALAPSRLNPKLQRDLETICLHCLEKEPTKRYSSASELADELDRFLHHEPIRARPPSVVGRVWRWCRRSPKVAALLAGLITALLGGSAGVTSQWLRAESNLRIAEEERDHAEANFNLTLAAVDQILVRVQSERFDRAPGMKKLQQQVLEDALRFYQGFLVVKGDSPKVRHETSRAYGEIARIYTLLHHLDQAEQAYAESQRLLTDLVAQFPKEPLYRSNLASNYGNLSRLAERQGKLEEAETLRREAVKHSAPVTTAVPTSPTLRLRHASHLQSLAGLVGRRNRIDEARQTYQQALDVFQSIAGDSRQQAEFRYELAQANLNFANLEQNAGQDAAAERLYRDAIGTLAALAKDFPDIPEYRKFLAAACCNVAILLGKHSPPPAEAEQLQQRAVEFRTQLVADFDDVPDYQRDLAESWSALAVVQRELGRGEAVEASYRQAVQLWDGLDAETLANPSDQLRMAMTYFNLGLLLKEKDPQEAERLYRRAAALRTALLQDSPGAVAHRVELGAALNSLGLLLVNTDRNDEGVIVFQEALTVRRNLADEFPDHAKIRSDVGGTLNNLAQAVGAAGDFVQSRQLIDEAIQHQQAALKADPTETRYAIFLRNHYWNLADCLIHLDDHAAAVRAAIELIRLPGENGENHRLVAEFLARCVPLAEKDESLPTDQRATLAANYSNIAIRALRDAVARGFRDLAELKNNAAFESLRKRPDFAQVLQELETALDKSPRP